MSADRIALSCHRLPRLKIKQPSVLPLQRYVADPKQRRLEPVATTFSPGVTRDAIAGLLEANWLIGKGHNLKFSHEYLDPNNDLSEDHRLRNSLVWEYTPMQLFQTRIGLRSYDGVPQVDGEDRNIFFAEIHGFF